MITQESKRLRWLVGVTIGVLALGLVMRTPTA